MMVVPLLKLSHVVQQAHLVPLALRPIGLRLPSEEKGKSKQQHLQFYTYGYGTCTLFALANAMLKLERNGPRMEISHAPNLVRRIGVFH